MVLVALGSVLFVRVVMPDLWIQLTQELPQRLASVTPADPGAEQPQTGPPVEPAPASPPGAGSPLPPPAVPAQGSGAAKTTDDGQAAESEADEPAKRTVAATEEPSDALLPAGTEAPGDATADTLDLPEDLSTATGRASREASSGVEAAGLGNTSPADSSAGLQVPGGNELADAATTPTAWQAFWKPFRAERSATGFASHVGQATGLPIEIRRTPRGEYVVGFSYGDELELERNIALIEARTGLRVLAESNQ